MTNLLHNEWIATITCMFYAGVGCGMHFFALEFTTEHFTDAITYDLENLADEHDRSTRLDRTIGVLQQSNRIKPG